MLEVYVVTLKKELISKRVDCRILLKLKIFLIYKTDK